MAVATPPLSAEQPAVPWDRVERFVGQLTHDIRNGLNALELQLTFLGEISTDPEAIEEIKRLRGSLGAVTRQLQTLRNATGTTTPYALEYPAGEFFDDLRERLTKRYPDAAEKIIWTISLIPETSLEVDPELTIGALLELLANALHFAQKERDPIHVTVSTAVDRAVFVLDEPQSVAPVIPPSDWGRTPLLTTRRRAYGLGLFRVRRCLESQGCTLDATYSPENQLLTSKVTLRSVLLPSP